MGSVVICRGPAAWPLAGHRSPPTALVRGCCGPRDPQRDQRALGLDRRGVRRLGGKDPAVILPEFLQCAKHYSLSNSIHGVKVKVEIMQRVKGARGHFAGLKKMPQIGSGKVLAGIAGTLLVQGAQVLGKFRVLDVQTARAGK